MATTPNNVFATNVFTKPNQKTTPAGAPNVIILDFDTAGITDYSISTNQLSTYITYIILTGATTGTSPTIYLPSTTGLYGQTIMIKNATPDNYSVQPVLGVQLDAGTYPSVTLMALGNTGDTGAITVIANSDPVNSWYIIDSYIQL